MAEPTPPVAVTFRSTAAQPPSLDLKTMLQKRLDADKLRMPPYPAIALKLQQMASSGRTSTRRISATIGADPALVASVLRAANAAVFGTTQRVIAVDAAISRLGLDHVVRIAIAQSVGASATGAGPLHCLRRDVWRRSLLASKIALALAPARFVEQDAAFVAGLLHGFGAITVLVGLEDLNVELPVLPAEKWAQFVEYLQVRFGRVLAERWRLPEPIRHSIEHCFAPERYTGPHKPLVRLTASVVQIIRLLDASPLGLSTLHELENIGAADVEHVRRFVPQIAELMDMFEPRSIDSATTSAVEPAPVLSRWPIHLVATCKGDTYQAVELDADSVVLTGSTALMRNWLVSLSLHGDPRIDMLANVISCSPIEGGMYRIVAKPFALGGTEKHAWLALLQRTRPR